MAERVFPNNSNVDMGSKISFSGIDWNSVGANMKNNRVADDHSEAILKVIKELIDSEMGGEFDSTSEMSTDMDAPMEGDPMDVPMDEEPMDEEPMDEEPMDEEPMDEEPMDEEPMDEEPMDEEKKSFPFMKDKMMPHDDESDEHNLRSANKSGNKISFTSFDQISHKALENAERAGDVKLANTISAARKANRLRIAQALEAKQKQTMSYSELEEMQNTMKQNTRTSSNLSFTSPTDFNKTQRTAFNKIAMELGMPQGYVEAMCPRVLPREVTSLNSKIHEITASNISQEVKDVVITNLIKEAKLSPDSKSEFVEYWNSILGYQDKEFWPLVAADYQDGKKVK